MVNTVQPVHQEDKKPDTTVPRERRGNVAIPLATCGIVAGMAQLPALWDRWFYFHDDAATQILPMWFHLGERIQNGQWPPLLDLDAWMGGNLAVEALFGVWNPVYAGIWWLVSVLPNLAVAAILVRTLAFVAIALGCYLLCREYGARQWAASAVAVVLPFCGPLLYFDAAKWPAALLAFCWVPYLWWAVRRMAQRRLNPLLVFVLGALAVTAGNPYGMLAVCIVLGAMSVETWLLRGAREARRVVAVSVTIGAVVPLVYLPLLGSTHMTWRTATQIGNSGNLTPGLGDLVNVSFPNYLPEITGSGDTAAVFFCWFALPLAAWLNWSVLRSRWRELIGCLLVGGAFLMLALGPGELWMFRWPLRVLHYGYLAAAILLAVLLSAGLRTNQVKRRARNTAILLAISGYLVWSAAPYPELLDRLLAVLVLLGVLTAAAVWAARRQRGLIVVLQVGTVVTFGLQVPWFMGDYEAMPYYFPASVAEARAEFENRYRGQVLQIGDPTLIGPPGERREAWRDVLPANLSLPAGVHSINAYTGMGMAPFADRLCFTYHGSTCPRAYAELWRRPPGVSVPLADLLRLDTVVVQRKMIDEPRVPAGWQVAERNQRVTVLTRQSAVTWPAGRLSWAAPGFEVARNTAPDDQHETLRFTRNGGSGRLIFARIAWPGYHAEVNGVRVPAYAGPAGLLEVRVPPGTTRGELRLSWTPPRLKLGLALAGLGLAGATALGIASLRSGADGRRRATRWR